jgi:hypothetical protein
VASRVTNTADISPDKGVELGEFSAAKCLGYSIEKYESVHSPVSGIRFIKRAANNPVFTFSMYDKVSEVLDNADKDTGKCNAAILGEAIDVHNLKHRVRCELQIYPDTFRRGVASKFKDAMGITKDTDVSDIEQTLHRLDVESAALLVDEAVRQLGLRYMLTGVAPEKYSEVAKVSDAVPDNIRGEVTAILDLWVSGEDTPLGSVKDTFNRLSGYTRASVAKAYDVITDVLGLDIRHIPPDAIREFIATRNSLISKSKYREYLLDQVDGKVNVEKYLLQNVGEAFKQLGKAI